MYTCDSSEVLASKIFSHFVQTRASKFYNFGAKLNFFYLSAFPDLENDSIILQKKKHQKYLDLFII